MVARRLRIGQTIQTIFTTTAPPPNGIGNLGALYTIRNVIPISGGNLGRVRVTFSTDANPMTINNASVGVHDPAGDDPVFLTHTLATPNELLFSGLSGFTGLAANSSITSDWVTVTGGFSASDSLVVIFDLPAANDPVAYNSLTVNIYFGASSSVGNGGPDNASYNIAVPTSGYELLNGRVYNVVKIETGP